jgi:hypothetical protein
LLEFLLGEGNSEINCPKKIHQICLTSSISTLNLELKYPCIPLQFINRESEQGRVLD